MEVIKMTVIFKAKTHEGYIIKILAELLQNNIKTACLEVDATGISLCMMNNHHTVLFNFKLDSDNFSIYKYRSPTKMHLGINLNHFYKMLKMIKKKDSVQLFINDKNPTDLGIKVIPKENNRVTTSYIKIQTIQIIDTDIPAGYFKPIIVPSAEFQKMCKDLSHISNVVNVVSKGFQLKFNCDAGGVMKRQIEFGENDVSDFESDTEESVQGGEYNQEFKTEQLSKISKISGLSSNLQIYPREGLPLLLKSQVGSLGKISVFLKSSEQITEEKEVVSTDSDVDF